MTRASGSTTGTSAVRTPSSHADLIEQLAECRKFTFPDRAIVMTRAMEALASHDALVSALLNFSEWAADHFEEFGADISAQLLCLENDASAALAQVTP